jgi:Tol biopolymer transport system component
MLLALLGTLGGLAPAAQELDPRAGKLLDELRSCKFRIVYESYRNSNWELMVINADGANPVNITQTPDVDEMFPRASPDRMKVAFLADEGQGEKRTRNVYCMNIDGTGRIKVGQNGREPFWSPDGRLIAYAVGTHADPSAGAYDNRELHFYNIETKEYSQHPNKDLSHLLNPCWSSDGKWIIASVVGGMGLDHSIAAIEANGSKVVELERAHREAKNIYQCRPDLSPDGRYVAWGKDDMDDRLGFGPRTMWVEIGDIDLGLPEPKVTNYRYVVTVKYPLETYHVDWSPDGKYIAYSRGERGTGKMAGARPVVGSQAPGWDIWVVKPSEPEVTVQLTHDGLSNKEPDWVPIGQAKGARDR